jgi:corrinoid protein of di/trimethylamine methyltransferase
VNTEPEYRGIKGGKRVLSISERKKNEILDRLARSVVEGNDEEAFVISKEALKAGIQAYEAVSIGLAKGMAKVGELYECQEYFLPNLLLSADAAYAALNVLKPHIKKSGAKGKGKVVIGTVEGDIHDIGKSLVKTMLDATGYEVIDLGRDVPLVRFVEEAANKKADIVAMSALMTTSMATMEKVILELKKKGAKAKIMVGGAPLSFQIAKEYGADGYGKDASAAVEVAAEMMKKMETE